jgi:serine protease SohB
VIKQTAGTGFFMQTFADWVQFLVSGAVVVLLLLVFLALVVLIFKRTSKQEKAAFAVEHLNSTWEENQNRIRQAVLPRKAFAKIKKEQAKIRKSEKDDNESKKNVFVVDFDGDVTASACTSLRDLITALLTIVRPNDEVVVRLESGGGVVHGYGLAASQLARLKDSKIPLTICVDKIAASGGYMMACVANRIVAAPFSIIGSIGVVSSTPNFNRLLKKHDIDFVEQTAGDHKRTVTLFGELTDSKKYKHQQDIIVIHELFKQHVAHFRPQVDINVVSTGEIWMGRMAHQLHLVDELKTSDDLLVELGRNANVYLLKQEQAGGLRTRLMKHLMAGWSAIQLPLVKHNPMNG